MKYEILRGDSPGVLEQRVEEKTSEGWILVGGVSAFEFTRRVDSTDSFLEIEYLQAMCFYEPIDGENAIRCS